MIYTLKYTAETGYIFIGVFFYIDFVQSSNNNNTYLFKFKVWVNFLK